IQLGVGYASASGKGFLERGERAMEVYTLHMLPVSANIVYRFEYARNQGFVPFILGGGTVVGLLERRGDGKTPGRAAAPAAGGAAGIHISATRLDPDSAFKISSEYGVADLWFTLEGRVLQGLRSDVNYSTQIVQAGVTMDF